MRMQPILAILAVTAASVPAPVLAAESPLYGVLSVGWSQLDANGFTVDNFNVSRGFANSTTSSSSGALSGKAQLGYNLGKTFALEGGYTYLGQANFTSILNGGAIAIGGNVQAYLFNLDLVGKVPVNEKFSVLARFGGYYWKTRSEMPNAVTLGTATVNDNGYDYKMGAGVQYEFTPKISMRGEFERFNGVGNNTSSGDSKVNQLTVGAVLKF